MNDSILITVKKLLGISADYTQFDVDIIIHINSVFAILHDMGVGPNTTYSITDSTNTWNEFIQDSEDLDMVKSYMYMKVRMIFDPPAGQVAEAMNNNIKELEWRMYHKQEY